MEAVKSIMTTKQKPVQKMYFEKTENRLYFGKFNAIIYPEEIYNFFEKDDENDKKMTTCCKGE